MRLTRIFLAVASLGPALSQTISVTVLDQKDTSRGVNGRVETFMSTSFQPAEWDSMFFQRHPAAAIPLWRLAPQHIRIQPVSQGVPQKAPDQWDFSQLDAVLIPVLSVADHSPEIQIATAPSFFMNDAQGHLRETIFKISLNYSANQSAITTKAASMRVASTTSRPARIT